MLFWLIAPGSKPRHLSLSEMLLTTVGLGGGTKQWWVFGAEGWIQCLLLILVCLLGMPRDKAPVGSFPPFRRIGLQTHNRTYLIQWSVSLRPTSLPLCWPSVWSNIWLSIVFVLQWYLYLGSKGWHISHVVGEFPKQYLVAEKGFHMQICLRNTWLNHLCIFLCSIISQNPTLVNVPCESPKKWIEIPHFLTYLFTEHPPSLVFCEIPTSLRIQSLGKYWWQAKDIGSWVSHIQLPHLTGCGTPGWLFHRIMSKCKASVWELPLHYGFCFV